MSQYALYIREREAQTHSDCCNCGDRVHNSELNYDGLCPVCVTRKRDAEVAEQENENQN